MAGQRTKINLGAISVEVSLEKTSSEPKGAKWETKTVDAPDLAAAMMAPAADAVPDAPPVEWPEGKVLREQTEPVADDPFGAEPEHRQADPSIEDLGRAIGATEPAPEPPPKPTVLRGVTLEDGEFVDLTDRLAAIDEDVARGLDGMEIVAAIGANTVSRMRTRGSSFVVPVDTTSRRACAMLYAVLGESGRGLAVRWTKRTNQALGVIVASKPDEALVLLEVEFASNMKAAPAKARLASVADELTAGEREAALRFVQAIEGRKADLDSVADERRERHAALLEAAREGNLEQYDREHVVDAEIVETFEDDFASALAGQA